jgi:DMSO/TMAO reductase YedYZ molybdopterin-dependent catalytic subunit
MINRILLLILLMVSLNSCVNNSGIQEISSSTPPTAIPSQAETLEPSEMPSAFTTPGGTASTQPGITSTFPELSSEVATPTTTPPACRLEPIGQPTMPTEIPLPNEVDTDTGLHMTGKPQLIDIETYRLKVTGLVDNPLSLTLDELRCMRKVTSNPYLTCPGSFTDYASWTGVPIKDILVLASVQEGATTLTLVSADGYTVKLPLETAGAEKNFLAYAVDGKTLPVLHGFPLRAVFPGMWGSNWLKWLVEIRIS